MSADSDDTRLGVRPINPQSLDCQGGALIRCIAWFGIWFISQVAKYQGIPRPSSPIQTQSPLRWMSRTYCIWAATHLSLQADQNSKDIAGR